ncbi:hypothetical protein [Streptomyces griseosporeus]|uniref:hypothetical protein n=1 Tax=Streptomyces griseosporeus TaxID=1910 RepID=UPI0037A069CF
MTVPIDVSAALIFLVSCAVGYAVFRHTRTTSTALPPTGDLGAAFNAGLAVIVGLGFLFGVTPERHETPTGQPPAVSVSSSPTPGGAGGAGTPLPLPSPAVPVPGGVPSSSPSVSASAR